MPARRRAPSLRRALSPSVDPDGRGGPLLLRAVDVGGWSVGLLAAALLVQQFELAGVRPSSLGVAALTAGLVHGGVGDRLGLYARTWPPGSRDELGALGAVCGLTTAGLVVLSLVVPGLRLAEVLAAAPLALAVVGATRLLVRAARERRLRPPETAARTVVVGAGDAGRTLVHTMLCSPDSPYLPVALVDDDPRLARCRVHGLRVLGGRDVLVDVVTRTGATAVVIAVVQADRTLIRSVRDLVVPLGVDVRVLPSPPQMLTRPVEVEDLRPISPADLLGRQETRIDLDACAGYLTGRRVLVTGAGGSIGSELCRQIDRLAPSRLVLLDRDESALHGVKLSLSGQALLDERDVVVADIRDARRLDAVFAEHRPDVVFHAAALKHLPLLQMHPGEAVQTNVRGTANVLRACSSWGVERMVNISTDKAADPCSVLGYSKRIAERLTAWWSSPGDLTAISVRFGNVLGSRGSVLTTFREQIRRGGPVTVTDRAVTRYFMTVEEAVGLVVQAGAIGRSGEVLVLDMGDPVSILDVVRRLMDEADVELDVRFTGLRPGEKLHEVLLGSDESDARPVHPLVSHVPVPPLHPEDVGALDPVAPDGDLVRSLRDLCRAPARSGAPADVPATPSELVVPDPRPEADPRPDVHVLA